jgi:hypothetical protein
MFACLKNLLGFAIETEMIINLKKKIELQKIKKKIENQIKNEKKKNTKSFKILILGTAESGKSTFLTHMRLNNGAGFSEQERRDAQDTILSNLLVCVYIILCQQDRVLNEMVKVDESQHLLELTEFLFTCLSSREESEISHYVSNFKRPKENDKQSKLLDICESEDIWDIRKLRKYLLWKIWNNQEFTNTLLSLGHVKLPDSALYFLTHFERIIEDGYLPTNKDMLFMKKSTTGVYETSINFQGHLFRMVEVGGQRSERRKWIHCFEDVDSTIFMASLAEYDMNLVEDFSINRLRESIALFKIVLETELFKNRKIILFLNKVDLFEEKIHNIDIRVCFADYDGKYCNKNDSKKFIVDKFLEHSNRLV